MSEAPKNGTARVQLVIAAIGVIGTFVISGIVATIWVGGIQDRAVHNTDRIEALESRMQRIDSRFGDLTSRVDGVASKEDEIETQFCDTSNVINLMHANDMRSIALLWQKAMAQTYPTDNAFYPVLCHKDGHP